jgi:hypothetical protein
MTDPIVELWRERGNAQVFRLWDGEAPQDLAGYAVEGGGEVPVRYKRNELEAAQADYERRSGL